MKTLANRVNIIPLIAKADGLTRAELNEFKYRILEEITARGIPLFEFDRLDSSENIKAVAKNIVSAFIL